MIKVLIVDDAKPIRERLAALLGADHFLNKKLESKKVVATITGSPAPNGTAHRLIK